MQVEAMGVIAIVLGSLGWLLGPEFAVYVFVPSTLLGASGAVVLPSLGYANIDPAHLLLGFFAVFLVILRSQIQLAARTIAFPGEGFWLLLTALWGGVAAALLPRLFAGSTYVFAIARTEIGLAIIAMPLEPTSGNLTQPVYFFGDLICFLGFFVFCARAGAPEVVMRAIALATAANLCFACLDLVTFWTHTQDLMGFIRNASYRMLDDAVVLGLKRIVGSFPEASTFAYYTLGWFAFCVVLWLRGVRPLLMGSLGFLSFVALLFSTSSTGYLGTSGFLLSLFAVSLARVLTTKVSRPTLAFVAVGPLVVACVLIALALESTAWAAINSMVGKTLIEKLSSNSGVERSLWNQQALTNFVETSGLGAGVGSVRASSFPIAVLSNIGVIGVMTYGCFLAGLLFRTQGRWREPIPAACQSAARWACFAQLIAASVAGSFIDLGLPFFMFAGLACSRPLAGVSRHWRREVPLRRNSVREIGK